MQIQWIKLSTSIFDDEKIKLIRQLPEGEAIIILWIQILCLAGKCNDGGLVYLSQSMPYTDEMIAALSDYPVNIVRLALETFLQFEMIETSGDGKLYITNWENHQNIEGLDKIREQNRIRQERHRKKQLIADNVTSNVTSRNRLEETREELDKKEKKAVKPPAPPKNKYGEFQNVRLTTIEHQKLIDTYGSATTKKYIENLSGWLEQKGSRYKSHYATIRNWCRRDSVPEINKTAPNEWYCKACNAKNTTTGKRCGKCGEFRE